MNISLKSNFCFSCNNENQKFGYVQEFNENKKTFMDAEGLFFCRYCNNTEIKIQLQYGGDLAFYPDILNETEREEISTFMDECNLYRQYRTNSFKESRKHVLLSSHAKDSNEIGDNFAGPGYGYHSVTMKAIPLSKAPLIEKLAANLGTKWNIPNNDWNIGVELVIYKAINGKIGWHADDTQGEKLIATLVVYSDDGREIKIRPKQRWGKDEENKEMNYRNGDEQITLFMRSGDGYTMDGKYQLHNKRLVDDIKNQSTISNHLSSLYILHSNNQYLIIGTMQEHYEHCVPKMKNFVAKERKVLVFRHGQFRKLKDNGGNVVPDDQKKVWFGHPPHKILHQYSYSRRELSDLNIHE